MSTITNLENIDPETAIDVQLTAKELLYLREFIGFMLPDYIADTELTDMYYIGAVSNVFTKADKILKDMGLELDPFM